MKKVLTLICLLAITTGIVSAYPYAPQNHPKPAPSHQKVLPPPKPVSQVPPPMYNNSYGYNNSPYVTFSLGNVDVTLGL